MASVYIKYLFKIYDHLPTTSCLFTFRNKVIKNKSTMAISIEGPFGIKKSNSFNASNQNQIRSVKFADKSALFPS